MTYHSVIDYIRAGRACGLNDHEIGEKLKKAGWLPVDVQDAFELGAKMEKVMDGHSSGPVCPPDHIQEAPAPKPSDKLMSRKTPHISAARFTMWFTIILAVFYAGYALMR